MIEFAIIPIILAACIPNSELSLCSAVAMQIGTQLALWMCLSFVLFWSHDAFDSLRLNRGGKVHLEAGVCGCRVGFNGERIHFGAGGCRCVGGNKNRGLVDLSVGNALENTLTFAYEAITSSPELALDLASNICNCIVFLARVSLGIAGVLSVVLRELDKSPAIASIVSGLIAAYFGEEHSTSIALGILFVKYPSRTTYTLCFSIYIAFVFLKRLLIQWPLALVKSLTSFVRSGGHAEDCQIEEESESGQVEIVLKLPSLDDGLLSWKPVAVGVEVGATVDALQRFCCALLPGLRCVSQVRLISGGRWLADPESVLELKSGQVIYCNVEMHGGMFGQGPNPAWDISPPGRRYVARDVHTPGVSDEQARLQRQERGQEDQGQQGSPSAETMLDAVSARIKELGDSMKEQVRAEVRRESIAMQEMFRRESGVTFQPMVEQQKGPVRLSLMERRELGGNMPSKMDTEPSVVKGMDLYLGNKADPPSQMPDLKDVHKLEERLVAISGWLVAFERYVKSSLSVTDVAEGHDLLEASEELWGLVMDGIVDWTSSHITREGSLTQGSFTLACAWDGGTKGKAYTKWAFRVNNTVVGTLGALQAEFDTETAFLRLSPMQQILATPIFFLKQHGIKNAHDVTYICGKIQNPDGWIVNRDGKEFENRLRRWSALSDAFDRLVPPILQQAGGDRAPNQTALLNSLRSIVNSWLKLISEHHKSELNKICGAVHLFEPFKTTEDAAEQVTNAVLALASVSSELKKVKAPPQQKGKGGAHGYFAGKGSGKGKHDKDGKGGKKGGKSEGDADPAGKGQQQKKLFCFDFQQGKCVRENCQFLHEIDKRPPCWNFQNGHCKHGWNCRFSHMPKNSSGKAGGGQKGAEAPAKNP